MPLSREEERKLADIGRALVREDPEFAERIGVVNHQRQRMTASIVGIVSAVMMLLMGGVLVASVPAAGLIVAFYGVVTIVVVVVVFIRESRTAT